MMGVDLLKLVCGRVLKKQSVHRVNYERARDKV
jgi:hypothetical protein